MTINLIGLSVNDPVPGEYIQVDFAQGDASLGSGILGAVLVGNKLSTGVASNSVIYGPATPDSMTSESDAIALFGAGSELHRMVRRFLKVNKTTPLHAIAVAEGASAVKATGTITLTNTATSSGALRIFVDDEFVDVGFITGDTPTLIATAAVVAINGKSHWSCTATNVAGVITLTQKQGGVRGNLHRYFAKLLPLTGITTTVTPTASTLFSGGSVADDNTAALGVLAPLRFYYIVSAANDATQLGDLLDQVDIQANPVSGIRQRVFGAFTGSVSNAIALSTALNGARAEVPWLKESDMVPAELASNNAAVYSLFEAGEKPMLNFDFFGDDAVTSQYWFVKAPLSGAVPSRAEILAALNAGVTPIGVRASGSTYLVKRITTRFLNGAIVDYRVRDAHKVTVCDRFADDLGAKLAATMRQKQAGDDPIDNEPGNPDIITPRVLKASIARLVLDYAESALVQNPDVINANIQVDRGPATRLSARIPLQPVDILDQIALKVEQVS
jgi:phage tail sheath gpL-like